MNKPDIPYEYDARKEANYLHIVAKGERNLDNLRYFLKDLNISYSEHAKIKVLIDFRSFGEPMEMLDSWNLLYNNLRSVDIGFPKGAIVENPGSIRLARFYERVARNLGYNLAVFSSTKEAINWLFE